MANPSATAPRPAAIDMALDDIISRTREPARHPHTTRRPLDRRERLAPYRRNARGAEESTWQHDLYEERHGSARERTHDRTRLPSDDMQVIVSVDNRSTGCRTVVGAPQHGALVAVSNLHHEVTEEDLDELFQTIGMVKRTTIQYDRAGRSNGIAHVQFYLRSDANNAADRFHGVPLDGMPMHIIVLGDRLRTPERRSNATSRRPRERSPLPSRPHRRQNMSTGQLDADIDAYMISK